MSLGNKEKKVLVLASGGIDSTACIKYYIDHGFSTEALFINYNQPASVPEKNALTDIANHYNISAHVVAVSGISWTIREGDEIIGRNLLFASIGLCHFPFKHGLISMGIHSGSSYLDCSADFQASLAVMAESLSSGLITFDFPFGKWEKQDILAYCLASNIPLSKTYSCVTGSLPPCGSCLSCQQRLSFGLDE